MEAGILFLSIGYVIPLTLTVATIDNRVVVDLATGSRLKAHGQQGNAQIIGPYGFSFEMRR